MPARQRRAPVVLPDRVDDPMQDLGNLIVALARANRLDDYLDGITDGVHREAIERAVAMVSAAGWRSTPDAMASYLTKGSFKRWPYVRLLGEKFADAVEGRSTRQIWNLPARYGKSLLASQWGPVWMLDRYPEKKLALVSYGDDLASTNSGAVLDLLREHSTDLRVELKLDRQRLDRFITAQGGGLMSAGLASGLTGFGANGVIEDDPFKNWQEAHSPNRRQYVVNHYRSVVRLRLDTDDAFIIIVMTRWHEEDLAGVLEAADMEGDGEGWEIVRLPAIAEAPSTNPNDPPSRRQPDPLGRAPGEVLEPERFSAEAVRARARAIGTYLSAGMEQQRPSPEEGGELKRAWWQWADAPPRSFDDALTSWDMKLKDKKGGDYVVGQAWGRTGSDFWWIDQLRGQWNQVTTKTAIVLMAVRHPEIKRHVVENTGNGPEVMAELRRPQPGYEVSEEVRSELGITDDEVDRVNEMFRRGVPGLIPENPKGDKVARARSQSGYLEAGNVHLITNRPEADRLVDEAAAFPNGAHDDQVDAWSQAMKKLAGGEATATPAPRRATATPAPSRRATAGIARTRRRRG